MADDLRRELAKKSHISVAAAADELQTLVTGILNSVRRGRPVTLPGLGTFRSGPNAELRFQFSSEAGAKSAGKKV